MTHLKLTLCYLPVTAADDVVAVVCSTGLPGYREWNGRRRLRRRQQHPLCRRRTPSDYCSEPLYLKQILMLIEQANSITLHVLLLVRHCKCIALRQAEEKAQLGCNLNNQTFDLSVCDSLFANVYANSMPTIESDFSRARSSHLISLHFRRRCRRRQFRCILLLFLLLLFFEFVHCKKMYFSIV